VPAPCNFGEPISLGLFVAKKAKMLKDEILKYLHLLSEKLQQRNVRGSV